jgi:hypothetical protein
MNRAFEGISLSAIQGSGVRRKKKVVRRISVSSSESEVDIEEVLSSVVREYEGMRGRGGREKEGRGGERGTK